MNPEATGPLISVCILAGHGPEALRECLASLRRQHDAPSFELLVGLSREAQTEVVLDQFPNAFVCTPADGPPGARRNELIEHAGGELLLFLDDDVTVAPGVLRRLAEVAHQWPEVAVFGGPNVTPPGSSSFQAVQGAVLSSLTGAGPVSRRYGERRAGIADERWFTLCNLAVRRGVMAPFDPGLVCAEENELLAGLHDHGEVMRYDPSLIVFHTRRPTWAGFARQMLKYGRGRGQLLARRHGTTRLAFLAPSALLLYTLLAAVSAALAPGWGVLLLTPLAAYAVLVLAGSARVAATLRVLWAMPLAAALTLTIHACYGLGVLIGLFLPGRARHAEATGWRSGEPQRVAP